MIILVGTHRSGSSYVTGLLHDRGLPLGPPDEFISADLFNPLGYFEQRTVIDLNSQLITGFRRLQTPLEGLACRVIYATCPGPSAIARRSAARVAEMQAIGNRFSVCVIKDPRFSLTFPHWARYVRFQGVVVVMRHPEASARSLHRRDGIPLPLAYRFWDYHVQGLLRWLVPEQTLFVDFDRLAGPDAEEELRRLYIYFSPTGTVETFVERGKAMFLQGMRHWIPSTDRHLPGTTRTLWGYLQDLASLHRSRAAQGEMLTARR